MVFLDGGRHTRRGRPTAVVSQRTTGSHVDRPITRRKRDSGAPRADAKGRVVSGNDDGRQALLCDSRFEIRDSRFANPPATKDTWDGKSDTICRLVVGTDKIRVTISTAAK